MLGTKGTGIKGSSKSEYERHYFWVQSVER